MDGDLQIESGDIDDLMALLIANREHWQNHWLARLMLALDTRLVRFSGLNSSGRAKRNEAHHYNLRDSLLTIFLIPGGNIPTPIFARRMNRWPMRRLPNCPALRQNCHCSHAIMCWIPAGAGADSLPRLNPRPRSPESPCRKTSLRLPAMLYAQHHKPIGSALRCATIGNKPATLTRLYQLACSKMSARNIMTAILPALPDYS